ncbi:hypothetical protein EJB05_54589 [Eragrostis curvula]|uniref:Uncharacterized protein n=1 Tax=Eragrostis curvula TaxID=38414 RepID=A0A5J9SM06_9POAL|nr:hypothetical protein EJB05_54589 [Eragrostis curvula]
MAELHAGPHFSPSIASFRGEAFSPLLLLEGRWQRSSPRSKLLGAAEGSTTAEPHELLPHRFIPIHASSLIHETTMSISTIWLPFWKTPRPLHPPRLQLASVLSQFLLQKWLCGYVYVRLRSHKRDAVNVFSFASAMYSYYMVVLGPLLCLSMGLHIAIRVVPDAGGFGGRVAAVMFSKVSLLGARLLREARPETRAELATPRMSLIADSSAEAVYVKLIGTSSFQQQQVVVIKIKAVRRKTIRRVDPSTSRGIAP